MNTAVYGLLVFADDHMDVGDGWWVVMMIGMLLFWALVVLAIVWGIRAVTADRHPPQGTGAGDNPLAILDRSLAEGKISVEDYERRRSVLAGSSSTEPGQG